MARCDSYCRATTQTVTTILQSVASRLPERSKCMHIQWEPLSRTSRWDGMATSGSRKASSIRVQRSIRHPSVGSRPRARSRRSTFPIKKTLKTRTWCRSQAARTAPYGSRVILPTNVTRTIHSSVGSRRGGKSGCLSSPHPGRRVRLQVTRGPTVTTSIA